MCNNNHDDPLPNSQALGSKAAMHHIDSLLALFEIAPVNRIVLEDALKSKFNDFEDAVIHASALHAGAEYIITRNSGDFKLSELPVFEPCAYIKMLEVLGNK